jgi:hypothetical protein
VVDAAAPAWRGLIAVLVMSTVSAVQQMQEWAGQEEQKRQDAEQVGAMLRLQEEHGDEEKAQRREDGSSGRRGVGGTVHGDLPGAAALWDA